ncbi:MAG: hypothetical protein QNJ23_06570 [Woeseiaceae bacterium]|nr:hypothetical protein [Woeseiaceae bacterium]
MKTRVVRSTIVAILMLGLAIPGVASAGFFNWGCKYQGTWFGVVSEDIPALAGWMVTVEGGSYFYGTNNLESTFPAFDPRLPNPMAPGTFVFEDAVALSTMRGNWMRTGFNTFIYTTTGFGLDANGVPLYVAQLNGNITLSEDCQRDVITGTLKVFVPASMKNPFVGSPDPDLPLITLPPMHAIRAFINLP